MVEQMVILAGGLGSRLGALVRDLPKPLLPVGDLPFIEILMAWAAAQGVTRFVISAGYLGAEAVARYDGQRLFGADISVVVEPQPAGTGGALTWLRDRLNDRFFLVNGDSLFDVPLAALDLPEDSLGTLALRHLDDTGRAGVVETQGRRITAFKERGDAGQSGQINGGVYLLRRALIAHCAAVCSLEREVFPVLAARGLLTGQTFDGLFIDIGIPQDYQRASEVLSPLLKRLQKGEGA